VQNSRLYRVSAKDEYAFIPQFEPSQQGAAQVNQRLGSTRQLKTALASPRMAEAIHQALERSFVTANPLTAVDCTQ
jgi:hypothetical protein